MVKLMKEREIIVREWYDDKGLIHRREVGQELVRCKECNHSSNNKVYGCSLIDFNTDDWHRMYASDYCSRGERSE